MSKKIGTETRKECLIVESQYIDEVSRSFSKKRKLLSPLVLTLLYFTSPLTAVTYNVSDLTDNPNAINGGVGTLRNAILMANNDPNPSIILLPNSGKIVLEGSLPLISSNITFVGMGQTPLLIDGQGKYQVFPVDCLNPPKKIVTQNISVQNATRTGFNGGSNAGNGGGAGGGGPGLGGFMYIPPGTFFSTTSATYSGNVAQGGSGGNGASALFFQGGGGCGGAGPGGNGGSAGTNSGFTNVGGGGGGGGTPTTSGIHGGNSPFDNYIGGAGGASPTQNGSDTPDGTSGGDGGSNPGSGAVPPAFNGGNGTGAEGGGGGATLIIVAEIIDQGIGGSAVSGGGGGGGSVPAGPILASPQQPTGGSSNPNSATSPFFGGGGGGGGGSDGPSGLPGNGGNGGTYGGGGGGGEGGSSSDTNNGGLGGFGGGGGGQGAFDGTGTQTTAAGGYAGGSGGSGYFQPPFGLGGGGGGGGAGLGGVFYVDNAYLPDTSVTELQLQDVTFSGNSALGGSAGTNGGNATPGQAGKGYGSDVFMTSGASVIYIFSSINAASMNLAGDGNQRSGQTVSWTQGGLNVIGNGTLTLTNADTPFGANYTGETIINQGTTVSISTDAALGNSTNGSGLLYLDSGTTPATLLVTATTGGTRTFRTDTTVGFQNKISVNPSVFYTIGGQFIGNGGLIVTGGGELDLTNSSGANPNNYAGNTTVTPTTTLGLASSNSFPTSTTLFLQGNVKAIGSAITFPSSDTIDVSGAAGGTPTINAAAASITIDGPMVGSGATLLNLIGPNTITINAPGAGNTYSTNTNSTVTTLSTSGTNPFGAGTVILNGTNTWDLNATTAISSPIDFNSNVNLTNQSGINTFTGPLSGGATVTYTNASGTHLQISPTTSNANFTGTFNNSNGVLYVSGTSPLGGASATYELSGTTLAPLTRFVANGTYPNNILLVASPGFIFNANIGTTSILSGVISSSGSPGALLFNGSGQTSVVQITGANTFTLGGGNPVELNTIYMQVSGSSPFGASSNSIDITNSYLEFIGNTTIANNILFSTNPNYLIADTGTTSTLSGTLSGSGYTVGLASVGAIGTENGIITLAGTTTGAVPITINQGTLQTSSQTNLGTGAITFGGYGGNLELLASLVTPYTNAITVDPSLTTTPYGGSIILDPSTINTWSGVISGSSPLGIQGTGTLTLSGANGAFSGGFYINQALVKIASNPNLGTGPIHLSNSGALELTSGGGTYPNLLFLDTAGGSIKLDTGTNTWSGVISGTTPLSLLGTGALNLTANNSGFTGGYNINAATLEVTTPSNLGPGPLTMNGGTLDLLGTGQFYPNQITLQTNGGSIEATGATNTIAGLITGPGALTIPGPGTLVITGTNSFQGGTNLNGGIAQICGTGPLGNGPIIFGGGDLDITCSTSLPNNLVFNTSGTITTDAGTQSSVTGSLSGSGTFNKAGSGTLLINGNSSAFSGTTNIDAGLIQVCGINPLGTGPINFDGGNIEFLCNSLLSNSSITLMMSATFTADPQTTSTITSPISGLGTSGLTKAGSGTIILNGANTYAGDTLVTAGTLQINGTLPNSKTTVSVGATLSGTGVIKDTDVFGNLAPGNPTGTLTTTKTTLEPTSTFSVLLNGSPYSQLHSTGNVSILAGSILNPTLNPFLPMTYTVIQADGFVTGRFLPISSGSARFPITVRYDRHTVKVIVGEVPFANIIPTGNIHHIGACFDSLILNPTPELIADLNILNGLSASEIGTAFEQFDPGIYNAIFYAEEAVGERVRSIFTQHGYDRQYNPSFLGGVWTSIYGEEIQQHPLKDGQSFSGYKDSFNGLVIGYDGLVRKGLLSGGFAYAKSKMHWTEANQARADIDSYTGFIGRTWYTYPYLVDAFVSYTRNVVNGSRSIFIGPSTQIPIPTNTPFPVETLRTPINKHITYTNHSTLYVAHVGMISQQELFVFRRKVAFNALTYGNLDYLFVKQEPFNEQGGGATNISVHGHSSDFLRPELGFGLSFTANAINEGTISGDARVGFVKELRFIGHSLENNFAGNGCNFTVGALFPRQNLVATSINFLFTGVMGCDLSVDYQGLYGSHYSSSSAKVELTYLF